MVQKKKAEIVCRCPKLFKLPKTLTYWQSAVFHALGDESTLMIPVHAPQVLTWQLLRTRKQQDLLFYSSLDLDLSTLSHTFSLSLSLSCFGHASSFPVSESPAASQHVIYLLLLRALMSVSSLLISYLHLSSAIVTCHQTVITAAHTAWLISPVILIITDQRGMIGKVGQGLQPVSAPFTQAQLLFPPSPGIGKKFFLNPLGSNY